MSRQSPVATDPAELPAQRAGNGAVLRERPPLPAGPYVVAGLGRAGRAAAAALIRIGGAGQVAVRDEHESDRLAETREGLRAIGVRIWIGEIPGPLAAEPAPLCLVKSPGFMLDHPLIAAARERGVTVLDEMELGWRLGSAPVIGVTGTNGKSTVAHLVARCLRAAGQPAMVAAANEREREASQLRLRVEELEGENWQLNQRLETMRSSRRYRLGTMLAKPADLWRRVRGDGSYSQDP